MLFAANSNSTTEVDLVNLVDENDRIIDSLCKIEAHRGDGRLHQAISLFIFAPKQRGTWQLLIQKRSGKKIVGANKWANTLCANVRPGESHRECLQRRLREELGIDYQTLPRQAEEVYTFRYHLPCEKGFAENEIDHFFVLTLSAEEAEQLQITPNQAEVSQYAWVDWSALKKGRAGSYQLAPWFQLFLQTPAVTSCLEAVVAPIK